jgi:hypothetical protein
MSVGLEAGYLDVVEDVEIGASRAGTWAPDPTGDRNTLEVTGVFYLPSGSAMTGLLIWNGETILKGKLKPAGTANQQYEDFVDRNTSPPVQPRDPFFVRQIGFNENFETYEYKIYPVVWTEFRKIRVRYLVPRRVPSKGSGLFLPAPIFFSNANEGNFKCNLKSNLGFTRVGYRKMNREEIHDLPASVTLNYYLGEAVEMQPTPAIPVHWLQTSIPDGDWQGHYLDFHAPIPRKALEASGLIRETVILWKWNHPETFFENNADKLVPTSWGYAVKDQARRILQVADVVWENEGEVGLVLHSGDRHRPMAFGMGPRIGAKADRIKQIVNSIASDNYWGELAEQIGKPSDPELNRPTEAQNGVIGFHLAVKAAYSLFSPAQNRLRTILFLSVGPRYAGDAPIDDSLDLDFLKNVSLSALPDYSGRLEWPGVALAELLAGGKFRRHTLDPGTGLPVFAIQSVRMKFAAGGKEFARDQAVPGLGLSATPQMLRFAGHAMAPWSPEMRLELVATNGGLRESSHSFQPLESSQDTNLVKLWSKAPFRVSEKFPPTDLGAIFGVVDRSNSLLALDHDVAPAQSESEILAGGIPHLQPDEIFAPPKSQSTRIQSRKNLADLRLALRGGWIEFQLPGFLRGTIRIVTLSGKILAMENLRPGLGNYRFKLPHSAGNATLIVTIELDGQMRKFMLAGAALK